MALATLIPLTLIFCLIRLNAAKSFQQKGDGPPPMCVYVCVFFPRRNFRSTDERQVSDCDSPVYSRFRRLCLSARLRYVCERRDQLFGPVWIRRVKGIINLRRARVIADVFKYKGGKNVNNPTKRKGGGRGGVAQIN